IIAAPPPQAIWATASSVFDIGFALSLRSWAGEQRNPWCDAVQDDGEARPPAHRLSIRLQVLHLGQSTRLPISPVIHGCLPTIDECLEVARSSTSARTGRLSLL